MNRRRFPSLYEAIVTFGSENVYFRKPEFVKNGFCCWCGKPITGRRTAFCSKECSIRFNNATVWDRGRDSYSLRILYRDKFTCQDCGEFHAYKNSCGVYIPIDDGELEVHHIVPVFQGGGHHQENLVTLCKQCHRDRHLLLKEVKE